MDKPKYTLIPLLCCLSCLCYARQLGTFQCSQPPGATVNIESITDYSNYQTASIAATMNLESHLA